MLYVVPRFAQVYEDTASTLPFFSQLLLGFGNFVGNNALVLGSGVSPACRRLRRAGRFRSRACARWLNARSGACRRSASA